MEIGYWCVLCKKHEGYVEFFRPVKLDILNIGSERNCSIYYFEVTKYNKLMLLRMV